jgi:hypothetical protein
MRSRLVEERRRDDAGLSPAEAVGAALALGQRAIADSLANFGVDRRCAVRAPRRAGQAGRRRSAGGHRAWREIRMAER